MPLSGSLQTGSNYRSGASLRPADDARYPRGRYLWLLRTILLVCRYIFFALYLPNAIWNLYVTINSDPKHTMPSSLLSWLNALVVPFWIANPHPSPELFGVFAFLFLCILGGCIWATLDKQREEQVEHDRETRQIVLEEGGSGNKQLPERHEPPFDIHVLPHPGKGKFVGRIEDKAWLLKKLRSDKTERIVALYGFGGIGKTTLAAEAVYIVYKEKRFKDGIAVIRCQELVSAAEILQQVLARFDLQRRTPELSQIEEVEKDIFPLLGGKKALIVLDNVEPGLAINKAVTTLATVSTITILITSRERLSTSVVPLEARRELTELSPEESLHLLAQYLEKPVSALSSSERVAAQNIVEKLKRHTLAIKIVGGYTSRYRRDLETVEEELDDLQRAIGITDDEDLPIKLAFAKSIESLTPDARKLFFALAAFPSIEFSRKAAIAVAQHLNAAEAERNVDALVPIGLVDAYTIQSMPLKSARERWRLHPLMRALSQEYFEQWEAHERFALQHKVATLYADYSHTILVEHSNMAEDLISYDEANITGALEWACQEQQHVLVVALCEGLQSFWVKRSRIKDGLYYLPRGIEAAQTIAQSTSTDSDYQRLASLQQTYGQLLQHDGQIDEAAIRFEEALTLFNRMPNREGQYKTLVSLGEMAHHRGTLKEAEQHYRQSLEILRDLQGEPDGQEGGEKRILYQQHEGEILTFLGQIAQQRGRLREAEGYYKQSMETLQITGSYASQVHNYIHLGEIAQYRRQKEKAQSYYEDALAITRDEKDRHNEAWVLAHMSDLALTFKDMNTAHRRCQEALTLAQEVQHRRCECWMLRCQGRLMCHRRLLSAVETKAHYESALTMAQKIQDKREESQIYVYLGDLAQERDQMKDARANYEKALEVAGEIQDAVAYACIALKLGRLLINQNPSVHLTEGRTRIKEAVQLYASMKLQLEEREARYILAQYG